MDAVDDLAAHLLRSYRRPSTLPRRGEPIDPDETLKARILSDGLLLTDFGLCLELDAVGERLTALDEAIGSRFYIAPENEVGMNDEFDQRPADFYAYGKMCWALLAGRQPLPRERILDPENQLVAITGNAKLRPIDQLLRDLLAHDLRGRLTDWTVIIRELDATRNALRGIPEERPRSASERAVEAARRLRASPVVREKQEIVNESARKEEWFRELERAMQARGRVMEIALDPVIRELGNLLTVAISTGAPPLGEVLAASGLEFPDGVPREHIPGGMSGLGAGSVVFMIHSPQAIETLPTLTIRLWVTAEGGNIWVTRLPMMAVGYGQEYVPRFLLPHVFATTGPFPMLREATVNATGDFVEKTARLFITIAELYLDIVDNGGSPADPNEWLDRDLTSASTERIREP